MFGLNKHLNLGQPVNRASPLNRGRVGWWLTLPYGPHFGGPRFLDLCMRNHGTLTNGPTWGGSTGLPGGFGRLSFDGTNDSVRVTHDPRLIFGTGDFTVEWIGIVRSLPALDTAVIQKRTNGSLGYELIVNSTGTVRGVSALTTGGSTTTSITVGSPVTLAAVRVNGRADLFINGESAHGGAANTIDSSSLNDLYFSHDSLNSRWGAYDVLAVSIWNRGLSPDDVRLSHRQSRLGYPNELTWLRRPVASSQAGGGFIDNTSPIYHHLYGAVL